MVFSLPTTKITEKDERRRLLQYLLRRLFIDDWAMKLVALVITLTLWLGVTGLQTPTTTRVRNVPLNLLIASDLEETKDRVREVDLVLRGPKQRLDQILPRDLVVSYDLNDVGAGDRNLHLTPQNISLDIPNGIEVIEIQPNKIALRLEKVSEVAVPIKVETEGNPAPGYELYGTVVTPESVRVRGPESVVGSLGYVTTEKVDISRANTNFSVQQIPLNVVSPKITLLSAASVNVTVRVGRKRVERLVVVPFETQHRSGRASITLYGPADLLEALTPGEITIVEEAADDGRYVLRVVLPPAIQSDVEVRNSRFRE